MLNFAFSFVYFAKEVARLLKVADCLFEAEVYLLGSSPTPNHGRAWVEESGSERLRRVFYTTLIMLRGMLHVVRSVEAHVRSETCYCTSCAGKIA